MLLNQRAWQLAEQIIDDAERLRVAVDVNEDGTQIVDFGVDAMGGYAAGLALARLCLSDLAEVQLVRAAELTSGQSIQVATDHPIAACLASQYAGWEVKGEKFFAMGSGPMRAAAGREELFNRIGLVEKTDHAVGILESGKFPPPAVCRELAEKSGVMPGRLIVAVAPVTSIAGTMQVVARSVETALHKLDHLGFDLSQLVSGYGVAPLPPPAENTLDGIGRTNDAILYGAEVTLLVRSDDDRLTEIGPRVPSCASGDYGLPFRAIFEKHGGDFYKIDPLLFSPAVVTFVNLSSGKTFRFGHTLPRVLHESFGSA